MHITKQAKEANLKRLHSIIFQLYDNLEKAKLGSKTISGCQDEGGGMNK